MTTASPFDAALSDMQRLHAALEELSDVDDASKIAERAAGLALGLIRSSQCVVALGIGANGYEELCSVSADGRPLPPERAIDLLRAAGLIGGQAGQQSRLSVTGVELRSGGAVIGAIALGRSDVYGDTDRELLAIFAAHLATVIDRSELKQRQSAYADRLRVAERVEQAHELAVQVLLAVSSHAVSGQTLNDFYRQLAGTVGELVAAGKVVFWRLDQGSLAPLPGGFGVGRQFTSRLKPTPCAPQDGTLASRVVFEDLAFRANRSDRSHEFESVLDRLAVSSAISVAWRAGEERLGAVAAYDSTRPGGFSREDAWVLQKAGLAAGLVTQLWHAHEDLRRTVERLTKVDSARQLVLKNLTTVVERERKRFVSGLHDDALQKLTAAEMHIARLAASEGIDGSALVPVTDLLEQTEAALRRLVFEVHPPALDQPDGLAQSIRDRLSMLAISGIKVELELDIPPELTLDSKSLIFREVAEAVGNVEKHSRATSARISVGQSEGGVLGVIEDNGQGFAVAERSNLPGHLGLQALKERALMAGGRYKIDSQPGSGTRIEFWIPIDRA